MYKVASWILPICERIALNVKRYTLLIEQYFDIRRFFVQNDFHCNL